jgi:Holliday junction resolvase-like predicted endonuclease
MLTENDVVAATCTKLQTEGFEIIQSLHTSAKGIDIIAKKGDLVLYVEAKGETSALSTTKRYGKPFNYNQIESHVSRALLTASKLLTQKQGEYFRVAIALPNNDGHRKLINQIQLVINALNIIVIWVTNKDTIDIEGYN